MTLYMCPVCGYDQMTEPPEDYAICPCCGTQFDLDDVGTSHKELRDAWVSRGAPWFSRATLPPPGWNPYVQMVESDLEFDAAGAENDSPELIGLDSSRVIAGAAACAV